MRFHAGFIGGALSLAALGAGCGDDGGGVVSNSQWRMWTASTASFSNHVISGGDGDDKNSVECVYDGNSLEFTLKDGGYLETGGLDPMRLPSEINMFAYPAQGTCRVQVTEATLGDRGFEFKYEDSCAAGCTVNQVNADETTGILTVSLRCTQMISAGGSDPRVLAANSDQGGRDGFATFAFENCF